MATTLPSSLSLADAARVARASGLDWTQAQQQQQQRTGEAHGPQPTAAGSFGPAVVSHIGSAERGAGAAAPDRVQGLDRAQKPGAEQAKAPGTPEEEHAEELRALSKRDAEVRAHEQAHAAAGGAFAGTPSYGYERGPDGRSYAVSGEVPIDVSAIAGDPEATIQKMQQVKRAALAPRDPSNADRAIAATADALIVAARREQMAEKTGEGEAAGAAAREAFGAYERRAVGVAAYSTASAA